MDDRLYCGAAREKITPPGEWLPDLRGLMRCEYTGVVDDLYVRVIALRREDVSLLLVSFDMDKAPDPETGLSLLEKETGIPQQNILYTAIHAHSAPITGDRPYEGPNALASKPLKVQEMTRRYERFLQEKTLMAAQKAIGRMEPAIMGYGQGSSYVNVRRIALYETEDSSGNVRNVLGTGTDFSADIDHTLTLLRWTSVSGEPIAYFVNYPVHNTVMILNACGENGKCGISSDLGGNVSRQMEKVHPGAVCVWTSGAAGDINPIMSNQVYREDPESGLPVESYETDGTVALSMLKTLTAHHLSDIKKADRRIKAVADRPALSAGAAWAVVDGRDDEDRPIPYRVRVQRISIGPVTLFGFSGELYSGIGKRLQERLIRDLNLPGTPGSLLLVNHNASLLYNAGYIYGDEIFRLREQYEGDIVGMGHTWLRPGLIEDALLECMKELMNGKQG